MRDDYQKFTAKRIAVLAILLDDAESHRKFRKKYQLPFPLLVDADKAMTRAYGVQKHMELGGEAFDYAGRSLFLIGPDGKVAYADPDFKLTDAGWKALFAAVAKLPKPAKSMKKMPK